MKHPAYHLRPNKAVDRFALIEAIKRLIDRTNIREYTYYSLGGPTLEDFRLIYEFFPDMKMVCIEENEDTYKRQKFHRPCCTRSLRIENETLTSFLTLYEPSDTKSIFWLDYVGLEYQHFEDFTLLLGKIAADSMIKITVRCEPGDYETAQDAEEFRRKFEALLPTPDSIPPSTIESFAQLIQDMIQIASERALPGAVPLMFQPISSFHYTDGTGMFTLTGVVCLRSEQIKIVRAFKDWRFANLHWNKPTQIKVPALSIKERLHLQRHLPRRGDAGRVLRQSLGYLIDKDVPTTESQLQQYADFHQYFPYFIKATP